MEKVKEFSTWNKIWRWIPLPIVLAGLAVYQWKVLSAPVLLMRETLLVFGYAAMLNDIRVKKVPNRLVLLMIFCWIVILVPQLFTRKQEAAALLVSGGIGGALAGVMFLIVYLISRKGLGGGDVKFMAAAGLYLGFSGVLPAMLVGSLIAGGTGIVLILVKKMDKKGTIPLIPFLYIGIVLTLFFR